MTSESSPPSPTICNHESSTDTGTASTQNFHARDPPTDGQPKVNHSRIRRRRAPRSFEQPGTTNLPHRYGTGTPPPSGTGSSVSSITSPKTEKPLPSINVENITDADERKRAANTSAARRYRERKIQRVQELEDRVARLEGERDYWKSIALKGLRGNNS